MATVLVEGRWQDEKSATPYRPRRSGVVLQMIPDVSEEAPNWSDVTTKAIGQYWLGSACLAVTGTSTTESIENAFGHFVCETQELWIKATTPSKSELGKRLWAIRQRIVASGARLLNADEIESEIAERRGERRKGPS